MTLGGCTAVNGEWIWYNGLVEVGVKMCAFGSSEYLCLFHLLDIDRGCRGYTGLQS